MKPGKGAEAAETLVAWGIIERHILAPCEAIHRNFVSHVRIFP